MGPIKYNEAVKALAILDPDETWKNTPVNIIVKKDGEKIIWDETINGDNRIIVLKTRNSFVILCSYMF